MRWKYIHTNTYIYIHTYTPSITLPILNRSYICDLFKSIRHGHVNRCVSINQTWHAIGSMGLFQVWWLNWNYWPKTRVSFWKSFIIREIINGCRYQCTRSECYSYLPHWFLLLLCYSYLPHWFLLLLCRPLYTTVIYVFAIYPLRTFWLNMDI